MSDATHTPEPERVTIDPRVRELIRAEVLAESGLFISTPASEGAARRISLRSAKKIAALAAHPSPPTNALGGVKRSVIWDALYDVVETMGFEPDQESDATDAFTDAVMDALAQTGEGSE